MRNDLPLTQKEVEIYRHIYYKVYKPLAQLRLEESEIQDQMTKDLEIVGWTYRQFSDYKSIDLMQRLILDYSHELVLSGHSKVPMTSKEEYRHYDPNYGALRLKDNDLSSDPDQNN